LNVSSSSINFIEGQISNVLAAEMGDSFTPSNINKVTAIDIMHASTQARLMSLAGKDYSDKHTPELVWKLGKLIERYDIFSDIANEIQHSSTENVFDGFTSGILMSPTRATEYLNQSPMIAAILEDVKLKSIDPNIPDSTLLDATERVRTVNGYVIQLKPAFNTPEYRAAYLRDSTGLTKEQAYEYSKPYTDLKLHIDETINRWHGNYGKFRGMKGKENVFGQTVLSLKTWLPNQLFIRFAPEQDSILLGVKGYKGFARSHTHVTAALIGGAVMFSGGLLPMAAGAITAIGVNQFFGLRNGKFGAKTSVGYLNDLLITTQLLFKKMIGVPVNIVVFMAKPFLTKGGKQNLLDAKSKVFNTLTDKALMYDGGFKYTDMFTVMQGEKFTERDYKNFKANIRDIANIMLMYAIYFAAQLLYYSEDDPKEEGISEEERLKRETDKRKLNFLVNESTRLAGQATTYYDVIELANQVSGDNLMLYKFLHVDVKNFVVAVGLKLNDNEGDDIQTGNSPDKGEQKLDIATRRLLLPTVTKDPFELGFKSALDRQWIKTELDKQFWSDEKVAKKSVEAYRAELKKDLEDSGMSEEEINDILHEQVPYKDEDQTYEELLQYVEDLRKERKENEDEK